MKDIGKFIRKLESAYSDKGVVTYIEYAQKGNTYFFDDKLTIPLLVADGKINVKHFRRHPNVDIELIRDVIGSSESPEHFNAKRKIFNEKSININGTIIKGYSAEEEVRFPETNNIVDVVLYDSKGEVLLGVEVCYKNKKSKEAINKLNKLNINIYEKNITDIEQSRFLCLYGELYDRDNNNNGGSEFVSKKTDVSSIQQEIRELEEESRKDSKRIKDGREFLRVQQADINRIEAKIKSKDTQIANINEQIDEIEEFGVKSSQQRIDDEIRRLEEEIADQRLGIYSDKGRGLYEEIRRLEEYIKKQEQDIRELEGCDERAEDFETYQKQHKSLKEDELRLRRKCNNIENKIKLEERDIQEQERGIGRVEERIRDIRNAEK